jgi:hypothetical protein
MAEKAVTINRAPVLTLWAAIVAARLGHSWATALTLGKALAGLNAQSKGRSLGIYKAPPGEPGAAPRPKAGLGEDSWVQLCGRSIPAKKTSHGLRAVVLDKPIDPESVPLPEKVRRRCRVREAMEAWRRSPSGSAKCVLVLLSAQVARGEKAGSKTGSSISTVRSL